MPFRDLSRVRADAGGVPGCNIVHEYASVGTDGNVMDAEGAAHPRAFGTFPRAINRFVKERGLMPFEKLLYKMTLMPAQRAGISDRGALLPGQFADLLVLDYDRLADNATYVNSHALASGIDLVVINGTIAYEDGAMTNALVGRLLK